MSDHLPDDEFEKLFQKGSDKYDFEYNPRAWRDMETLLDRKRRRKLAFWWFGSFLGLVFLLLVAHAAGVFDFENRELSSTDTEGITLKENSILPPSQSENVSKYGNDELKDINDVGNKFNDSSVDQSRVETKESSVLKDLTEINNKSKNSLQYPAFQAVRQTDSQPLTDEQISLSSRVPEASAGQGRSSEEDQQKSQLRYNDKTSAYTNVDDNLVDQADQVIGARESHLYRLSIRSVSELPVSRLKQIPHSINPVLANHRNDVDINSRALILGLSIGVSSSSAGTMGYSDFDPKLGFTIQYFIHPKWSLSVGLNYINDSYDAGSYDYSPEEGYWTNQILPDWTSATCEVLELPLSIHFYPKGYRSSGFFGGLGIVSTIMINEGYYYHYRDPKPEYRKYWHGHMASKDWFSILELSFGYQKHLSNKSFLRFYPYIQLPVSGIGHGNVMLRNFGFSVQYGFNIKKS